MQTQTQTQQILCSLQAQNGIGRLAALAGHHQLPIDDSSMQMLIDRDPQMAATLLLRLAHDLAERLQIASRELALRSQDF